MAFRLAVVVLLMGCANAKSRFIDQYYTCEMGFFVSTTLASDGISTTQADAQCQALAAPVGDCGKRTWRAYLSSTTENARDRIGKGPWYNSAGELLATSIETLYASEPPLSRLLTQLKQNVTGSDFVMTGSNALGVLRLTCSASGNISFGVPGSAWSYASDSSCGGQYRFYCFASD